MSRVEPKISTERKIARLSVGAAAASLVAGAALAGDAAPSANQARCNAMGEGFFAVSGSDACVRISGYVASGADFEALRPARSPGEFGGASSAAMRTAVGASVDATFDTPMGPGRVYVDVGHDTYRR